MSGTQQIPLSFDLATCLADAGHAGATNTCPLIVGVVAHDAAGVAIDSLTAGPFSITADHVPSSLDITLGLADVATVAWGDAMVVAAPTGLGGATSSAVSFTTSDTSIATVSAAGVVTARKIGLATVTATRGQTTVVTRVQVSPRVTESLALGDAFGCALSVTGTAYCWGADTSGQLGDGGTSASRVPVPVSGSLTFRQIAADGQFACGLTSTRDLYCWGLPGGATTPNRTPTLITNSVQLESISVSGSFSCGLTAARAAYCRGLNGGGALGTGDTVSANFAVPVAGGLTFQSISAGFVDTCGIVLGGAGYCWGDNSLRTLGIAGTPPPARSLVPAPVAGGLGFSQLMAAATVTCGVAASVGYCWGSNFFGNLGTGNTVQPALLVPTAVTGGIAFASIKGARGNDIFDSTCGLTPDGTAYCWGANNSGQLGTTASLSTCTGPGQVPLGCTGTPTPVTTTAKFAVIELGSEQVCGITTTHTILC